MLGVLFDFRGRIGRVRFLAGQSGAFFVTVIAVVALMIALRLGAPAAYPLGSALVSLLGLVALLWMTFALQSKRLRDAGFEPLVVVPGLLILGVADYLMAKARPDWTMFPDSPDTLFGTVVLLVLFGVMLFHPARPDDEDAKPAFRGLALLVIAIVAGAALFLAVPPSLLADRNLPAPVRRAYATALILRGHREFDQKRYEAALTDYQRAVDIAPQAAIVWMSRGNARSALKDYAGAGADYDKALELDPRYANARVNKALLAEETGDLQGALAEIDVAVGLAPDHAETLARRAWYRAKLNQPEGAMADIERAAVLAPKDARIRKMRDDLRSWRAERG